MPLMYYWNHLSFTESHFLLLLYHNHVSYYFVSIVILHYFIVRFTVIFLTMIIYLKTSFLDCNCILIYI